jgi:hypothetical protein
MRQRNWYSLKANGYWVAPEPASLGAHHARFGMQIMT